jgi:hypothetical protein
VYVDDIRLKFLRCRQDLSVDRRARDVPADLRGSMKGVSGIFQAKGVDLVPPVP